MKVKMAVQIASLLSFACLSSSPAIEGEGVCLSVLLHYVVNSFSPQRSNSSQVVC